MNPSHESPVIDRNAKSIHRATQHPEWIRSKSTHNRDCMSQCSRRSNTESPLTLCHVILSRLVLYQAQHLPRSMLYMLANGSLVCSLLHATVYAPSPLGSTSVFLTMLAQFLFVSPRVVRIDHSDWVCLLNSKNNTYETVTSLST